MYSSCVFTICATFSIVALFVPSLNALPTNENAVIPRGFDAVVPDDRRRAAGDDLIGALISGVVGSSSGALKDVLGVQPPTCCDDDLPSCRLNAGKSKDGHNFMACYEQGSEEIFDFDIEAMKCIINLHYLQPDKCIDIKGSVCANGYGGGLMRGQMGWWDTKGVSHQNKISAQDSRTLQAAAESMNGIKINYKKGENAAIQLNVVSDTNDVLSVEIDFDGHQGSDC